MPTIRITTTYGVCVYVADRVVRDGDNVVLEERRDRAWRQVASHAAADVAAVHQLADGNDASGWLLTDVPDKAAAGDDAPGLRRRWFRRR
ncbi:MAG: hypothetical protein ACLGIG_08405 [Actinomycetes bacterium]